MIYKQLLRGQKREVLARRFKPKRGYYVEDSNECFYCLGGIGTNLNPFHLTLTTRSVLKTYKFLMKRQYSSTAVRSFYNIYE